MAASRGPFSAPDLTAANPAMQRPRLPRRGGASGCASAQRAERGVVATPAHAAPAQVRTPPPPPHRRRRCVRRVQPTTNPPGTTAASASTAAAATPAALAGMVPGQMEQYLEAMKRFMQPQPAAARPAWTPPPTNANADAKVEPESSEAVEAE